MLVLAWGGNHVTPLLPLYRDALHYSSLEAALLLAFYVLGLAPALLVGSAVVARLGERPALGFGLAIGAAASVVLALGSQQLPLLLAGRVLSGIGIGVAMTAGVELIRRLHVARVPGDSAGGVVRGSMTLTAGLGIGAAVSGVLATWAPAPTVLPYLVHLAVALVAAAALRGARLPRRSPPRSVGFTLPAPASRGAWWAVIAAAPWVFGGAAIAYATVPEIVTTVPDDRRVAYAALLTLLTLTIGTCVQPLGARLVRRLGIRAMAVGIAIMVPGFAVAALAAVDPGTAVGAVAAGILGAGFGVTLIAGLTRARALVAAGGGSGLVGGYYAATYAGFGLPALVAATAGDDPAPALLALTLAAGATAAALLLVPAQVAPPQG